MVTSAQCRPHRWQEDSRSAPIEKCHFAALLPLVALLAASVPALAADSIEELLHQDEADGHNDALRRNLNALTEEQWAILLQGRAQATRHRAWPSTDCA
jgi:hypothetical protein